MSGNVPINQRPLNLVTRGVPVVSAPPDRSPGDWGIEPPSLTQTATCNTYIMRGKAWAGLASVDARTGYDWINCVVRSSRKGILP